MKKYLRKLLLFSAALFIVSSNFLFAQDLSEKNPEAIQERINEIENKTFTLPNGTTLTYKEITELLEKPEVQTKLVDRKVQQLELDLRQLRKEFETLRENYRNHERHPPR